MKHRIYLLQSAVLLLVWLTMGSAQAALTNVADYNATVTAGVLNVRSGPSTRYRVIGSVKRNQKVVVTHHNGVWRKLKWGSKAAYVHGSYVKRATTSREVNVSDYNARISASALNVRSGPSTGYSAIGKRYRNQTVRVTHHAGVWRRIQWAGGRKAYVHGNYIVKGAAPSSSSSQTFNVTMKTFINRVGRSYGTLPSVSGDSWVRRNSRKAALVALAGATDLEFNENPWSTRKDKVYRIYSNLRVNATCSGSTLRVSRSLTTDTGKEGPLQTPNAITKTAFVKNNNSTWSFKYFLRAKPHRLVEPTFTRGVQPRSNPYIWQKITGTVRCVGGKPRLSVNNFSGSKFPTHRYWVNGSAKRTIAQNGMAELWRLTVPRL